MKPWNQITMEMNNADLYQALNSYSSLNPARFHMPGHKGNLNSTEFETLAPLDVTEISITDDLSAPSGAIRRLERRFASLYNAKDSLLLVNGSTTGNIAMLLSIGIGKRILVARNSHKSVLSGAALAGHELINLFPDLCTGRIIPEDVNVALSENKVDAVFITSPTYYGVCSDVETIAEIVHNHGAKLFIDCAHGAHFPFSEHLPCSPHSCDAWVVSCHKTLNSLTQSAVLNIGHSNEIDATNMRKYVLMIQSSSPSYLLMLSLENALENAGNWNWHCKRILIFRKRLSQIDGVECIWYDFQFDYTRLTLSLSGYTGYEFSSLLESYGIYPEMADQYSVVLITTPNDPDEWYERLYGILVMESCKPRVSHSEKTRFTPCIVGMRTLNIREAVFHPSELLRLEDASGRIAAQAVGVYPPGIAILFPGECITSESVQYLTECIEHGAKLFGVLNNMIPVCVE